MKNLIKFFTGFVSYIFYGFLLSLTALSFLSTDVAKANSERKLSSSQAVVDVIERLNTGGPDATCESCLHFSYPSNRDCPVKWIELAILRGDQRGISSPDSKCIDEVVKLSSSRDPLKTVSDVETYLRGHAGFSSLREEVPVISQCLSESVEVSRVGNWSFTNLNRILPESKHKLAVAEYYSDLYRLDRGMGEVVDNIAAIDHLITPSDLLKDTSCTMLSKEMEESCEAVRKCKNNTSSDELSSINQASQNTIIAMQAVEKIEEKLKWLKASGNVRRSLGPRPQNWKAQVERLESSKRDIENLYPWIVGRKFQSAYSADDFKDFTIGGVEDSDTRDNHTNQELIAKMSEIITEQLTHTKGKLQEKQHKMLQASRCLTQNRFCSDVDLEEILSATRPLDEGNLFTSTEDLKSISSSALFSQVSCLQEQRRTQSEMNKELAFAGLDLALIAGTMGLGSGIVGAKIAMVKTATKAGMRVGGSASKGRTTLTFQNLQGLGVIGADAGVSTHFIKEAVKQCDSLLNQLENVGEAKNKEDVCEDMSLQVKHTSDLKGCILQAGLASLPAVLGIGALAGGVATGTRLANQVAGDAIHGKKFQEWLTELEDASRIRNKEVAEEVLGKKLTDEQAQAVQRAHLVGATDTVGRDGLSPPGIGNYTDAHLREKSEILQAAGFSQAERRKLMEEGVVGSIQHIPPSEIAKLSPKVLQRMTRAETALLTKEQIRALDAHQVSFFRKGQIQALGNKVQYFTEEQIRALGYNVQYFTEEQIRLLGNKLQHLTLSQRQALDSVRLQRIRDAEEVLGKQLTDEQAQAVQRAHSVGATDTVGRNGLSPPGIGNYTDAHLREKSQILQAAGFSQAERRSLMEAGVVGRSTVEEAVQNIPASEIVKLPKDELQQLPATYLTKEQVKALGDKVQHLTDMQVRDLGNNVSGFTSRQIQLLGNSVRGFSSRQIELLGSNVSAFTREQIRALGKKVKHLTPAQVADLGPRVQHLTDSQFRDLGNSVSGLELYQMAPRLNTRSLPSLSRSQVQVLEDSVKRKYKQVLTLAVLKGIGKGVAIGGGTVLTVFGLSSALYDINHLSSEEIVEEIEEAQQAIRNIGLSDLRRLHKEDAQKIPPEMFLLFTERQLNAIPEWTLTEEQRRIIDR